jgi:hypothetical protein
MTETRIDELKQVLGARRRRLQRDLETKLREACANTSGEGASRGLDTAETSDADLQQDVGLALIEMSAEVLRPRWHVSVSVGRTPVQPSCGAGL